MKRCLSVFFALLMCANVASAAPVKTSTGMVRGLREGGVTAFKGIPFAAPPIGNLRFRPPQPVKSWSGVRDASRFAPACMQKGVSMPGETPPEVSEDCLYLNIWTPDSRSKRLPVMVWIHGGGFSNGSASMPLYWGDRLATRDVVVVTIAYRLGPLGFLAHPDLTREDGRSSGNYGLMDQVAALRWVHDNIAAFGGDPGRVTIAGQSAGAMSVSLLLAEPEARGLFHGAIGQSGGLFEPLQLAPKYRLSVAEGDGHAYAQSLGAATADDLRKLPAEAFTSGRANSLSHPVFDSAFLPQSPYDAYMKGKVADVPVLLGWNAEEARSLTNVEDVTSANFESGLTRAFGALPPSILAAYPHSTDPEAQQARLDFERDLRFGWDMWAWARLQSKWGHKPAYLYRFGRRPPFPAGSAYEGWGASHFAELWYMSGHLNLGDWAWQPRDTQLEHEMTQYWVNFIRTGNPDGPGLPDWPDFADGKLMRFDDVTVTGDVPGLPGLESFDKAYDSLRGQAF